MYISIENREKSALINHESFKIPWLELLAKTWLSKNLSLTHVQSIWELRERLAESQTNEGYLFKYDISLPLPHFYALVPVLQERLRDCNVRFVTGFGHLGEFHACLGP